MSDTPLDRLKRLGVFGPCAAALVQSSPVLRESIRLHQREQDYFGKCAALGLTRDDARMVLDREKALAVKYLMTPDRMLDRAWDQAIRHSMREPYDPFPDLVEYVRLVTRLQRGTS